MPQYHSFTSAVTAAVTSVRKAGGVVLEHDESFGDKLRSINSNTGDTGLNDFMDELAKRSEEDQWYNPLAEFIDAVADCLDLQLAEGQY